ncbi:MAG: DUF2752 domain-containing protein [Actinomycetales bacterium]|nr:DUF2752 domain-containing protein [Actinomycetales bacterium]
MSDVASPDVNRMQLLRDPLLVGAVGALGVAALHFRDPHESTWLLCPFKTVTGYPCPGCGGLRAINLLSNGEIGAAISSNLIAVLLVPVVVFAWGLWFFRRARGDRDARMITISTTVLMFSTIAAVVFGVLRVTPWGSWLAP